MLARFEALNADLAALAELSEADPCDPAVIALTAEAAGTLGVLEAHVLLNGPYDDRAAVCSISAGAGGLEAQDWALMLLRMYQRWCERRGYRIDLLSISDGNTPEGISAAEFTISGDHAYGRMRSEHGVHRLSRVSPHGRAGKRHTSFVGVEVVPDIGDADAEVHLADNEIRADTFRAPGPGGQHRNKADTAVRLTHLPTGISVMCSTSRSQHRNRASARRALVAKIAALRRSASEQRMVELQGQRQTAGFGQRARSYVLQPYTLVVDHRTGHKSARVSDVLDGAIDAFVDAWLRTQRRRADRCVC